MNQPAKVRKDHPMEKAAAHRVLVVGLGSMGKRRLRRLRDLLPDSLLAGADAREDRRSDVLKEHGIPTYDSSDAALQDFRPSLVFACTSPLCHGGIVLRALGEGCHTFSELNLDQSDYVAILSTAQEHNRIAFLSSTMLYRDEIEYIAGKIPDPEKTAYTYHVGQYLPDWHPWERIQDFFVFDPKTNGCRELFAIELPWLSRVFGKIADVTVRRRNISSLDISYPDAFTCLINHETGVSGALLLDVVSRIPSRNLRVVSEDFDIAWQGTPQSLRFFDALEKKAYHPFGAEESHNADQRYAAMISDAPYRKEIAAFLAAIDGDLDAPRYGYEEDRRILEIIDSIERS